MAENDPVCQLCQDMSTRFCPRGCGHFCAVHQCHHLDQLDTESESWLSNANVVSSMSDGELVSARLRLAMQLYAIDREIHKRKFEQYARKRPKATLSQDDLFEESIAPTRGKRGRKPRAEENFSGALKDLIRKMPKQKVLDLQVMAKKYLEDKEK